ncbi:hypothetical protein CR513_04617, partial [Mucuna pruriens]
MGSLVIHMLGKWVGFKILEYKLQKNWVRSENFLIVDMLDGYFFVQFTLVDNYKHVLFEGPWMPTYHYLVVQRCLLMELYHETFLKRARSLLGTILKIDKLTSIHTQGKFAGIYVKIDLQNPLVPKIEARGHVYCVEYEELHLICFNMIIRQPSVVKVISGDGEVVEVRVDSRASIEHDS